MSDAPTTQPILCCVGQAVAGNATQYVMDRMLQAQNVDWRVITVEVQPEDLSRAIAGIRAMKFKAVRFFEPYQRVASELVSDDPVSEFVGSISAARLTSAGWEGWDSLGFAVTRVVEEKGWNDATFILVADSHVTRSALAALNHDGHGSWKSEGSDLNQYLRVGSWSEEQVEEFLGGSQPSVPIDQLEAYLAGDENDSNSAEARDLGRVIIVGSDPSSNAQVLDQLPSSTETLVAGRISDSEYPDADCITLEEEAVAAMIYDFERWTGRKADAALIREAYEEFSDF